ncbi:hypothetical protein EJB05_42314, partial [Eragrostis curvula]
MNIKGAIHLCCALASLALLAVLLAAYGVVVPVRVTVVEASLWRLDLVAAPALHNGGDTARLAYNLSLAVAVRNPNWVMSVWRTAPLDAELRFAGRPFAGVQLAAGADRPDRIRAHGKKVYSVSLSASESAPLALERDAAAAEFAREIAAGVFELELVVAGMVKYQVLYPRRWLEVRCPLKVSLSKLKTATAAAAFAIVECVPAFDVDVARDKLTGIIEIQEGRALPLQLAARQQKKKTPKSPPTSSEQNTAWHRSCARPNMAEGDCCEKLCGVCCVLSLFIIIFGLPVILIAAYGGYDTVEVTVEDASLGRLVLAGSNGTTPSSLSYNLSLAVAVRNPNSAIHVWRTAPLDAELRLGDGDRPFALVRLAGAEEEPEGRKELIRPKRSAVYRVVAVAVAFARFEHTLPPQACVYV